MVVVKFILGMMSSTMGIISFIFFVCLLIEGMEDVKMAMLAIFASLLISVQGMLLVHSSDQDCV